MQSNYSVGGVGADYILISHYFSLCEAKIFFGPGAPIPL